MVLQDRGPRVLTLSGLIAGVGLGLLLLLPRLGEAQTSDPAFVVQKDDKEDAKKDNKKDAKKDNKKDAKKDNKKGKEFVDAATKEKLDKALKEMKRLQAEVDRISAELEKQKKANAFKRVEDLLKAVEPKKAEDKKPEAKKPAPTVPPELTKLQKDVEKMRTELEKQRAETEKRAGEVLKAIAKLSAPEAKKSADPHEFFKLFRLKKDLNEARADLEKHRAEMERATGEMLKVVEKLRAKEEKKAGHGPFGKAPMVSPFGFAGSPIDQRLKEVERKLEQLAKDLHAHQKSENEAKLAKLLMQLHQDHQAAAKKAEPAKTEPASWNWLWNWHWQMAPKQAEPEKKKAEAPAPTPQPVVEIPVVAPPCYNCNPPYYNYMPYYYPAHYYPQYYYFRPQPLSDFPHAY